MKSSERGMTLTEIVFTLGIASLVVGIAMSALFFAFKEMSSVEKRTYVDEAFLDVLLNLKSSCANANTISHPENPNLSCLKNNTCVANQTGNLVIATESNTAFNSAVPNNNIEFNLNGSRCTANDQTTDKCDYRITATYTVSCEPGNCVQPVLEANINLESTGGENIQFQQQNRLQQSYTTSAVITPLITYSSCQDAFDNGQLVSKTYHIDSDGYGGECPFPVYCDMSTGRGLALVINAPTEGYTNMPEVAPPLTPDKHGKLQDKYFNYLTYNNNSRFAVNVITTAYNELSVKIDQTNITGSSKVTANPASCPAFGSTYYPSLVGGSATWGFVARSAAGSEIGFTDTSVSGTYEGFKCNTSCNADTICGIASATCCENQLRGSVFVGQGP